LLYFFWIESINPPICYLEEVRVYFSNHSIMHHGCFANEYSTPVIVTGLFFLMPFYLSLSLLTTISPRFFFHLVDVAIWQDNHEWIIRFWLSVWSTTLRVKNCPDQSKNHFQVVSMNYKLLLPSIKKMNLWLSDRSSIFASIFTKWSSIGRRPKLQSAVQWTNKLIRIWLKNKF